MIFIALLMLVVGGMVLGVGLWANAGPVLAIIFMRILGVVIIALGIAYVIGCMLVIRKYPKYENLIIKSLHLNNVSLTYIKNIPLPRGKY